MAQLRQPLRIKDVAARAGVSPATVSRVLNGNVTVADDKREKVLAVVGELGYRPNRVASNLRRQQARMIGVLVSDIENPHFTVVVRAVEDAAYQKGYRVLVCNTDDQPAKQRAYLEVLVAERVAGAIISPSEPDAPEIGELIDHGACVVAFDRSIADRRTSSVVVANADGALMGTEHLIGAGHRKVGYISGPLRVETASERLRGYLQAMSTARLAPLVSYGDFRFEGGERSTEELVAQGATALLVGNNLMAVGALHALKRAGQRVGTDIAVVGIDDPPWAELTDPPLTALAQPVREMAAAAVDLLLARLDGTHKRPRRKVFEFELHHRGSCCGGGPEVGP